MEVTQPIVRSVANTKSYEWGEGCLGWRLLQTRTLSVIQEMMPPGTGERFHYHEYAQQLFFILKGIAEFEIDGCKYIVDEQQSIHIRPGVHHRIVNCSDAELIFLVISEPETTADRINL